MEDIPENVKKDLKFFFVKHMDDVLRIALVHPPTSNASKSTSAANLASSR